MKRLLKWVGLLLGTLIVIVVAAAIALPLLFDPNDYRKELVSAVKEKTGRDLSIDGNIGLSVFPWLGVEVGAMSLSNAPGFDEPIFASTQRVSVRVKLMPLLSRTVEADTIVVEGLTLNLSRNEQGVGNWEDLGAGKAPRDQAPSSGAGDALATLAIGGVSVENANLSWKDAASGQRLTLTGVRLITGAINPGQPVAVEVRMNIDSAGQMKADLRTKTVMTLDLEGPRVTLAPVAIEADLGGEAVPGKEGKLKVNSSRIQFDGRADGAAVDALKLRFDDIELSGDFAAKELSRNPAVSGQLAIPAFSLRSLLAKLGGAAPDTADPKALSQFALSAKLSASPTSAELTDLKVVLDDSQLTGRFAIPSFAGPTLRFALNLDAIDADRYLPPPAPEGAADGGKDKASGPSEGDTGKPDFSALRQLDLEGSVKIGQLKLSNLKTKDISAKLSAKRGLVRIDPISAAMYRGSYRGALSFDARKDEPIVKADNELKGIQAEPLLRDLNDEDRLSGTGDVKAALTTRGLTAAAVKSALNGKVEFTFTNGAVKGVNVARLIREAKAKLKGQSLPTDKEELKTDFSELTGSMTFKNGLGTNQDFLAKSPMLRLTGAGTADLVSEALDYKLQTAVVGTSKGQGGAELQELKGITIPLKVTGTFKAPEYGLDVSALGKALATSKVKELVGGDQVSPVQNIQEKLKEGGGVKGLLKGVLGN